jgi:fibronectin-binding autotransporter adhesin
MKKERAMWMTGTLAGLLTWSLRAQSLWLPAGGGDWDTAANWAPPAVPDGADVTVIVTNNIAADATINLGSSRTVGAVVIADGMGESGSASHKWDFNAAAAQTLTLQRTTGPAVINVAHQGVDTSYDYGNMGAFQGTIALNCATDLVINIASNCGYGFRGVISGDRDILVTGGGEALFQGGNSGNCGKLTVSNAHLRTISRDNAWQDPNLLLPGGNLTLCNAVLMHQNRIARTIGGDAGQIQFQGSSMGFCAQQAGNTANSGPCHVNLNNDGGDIRFGDNHVKPLTLFLNRNPMNTAIGGQLPLIVQNSLDLNGNAVAVHVGPASGAFDALNTVTIAGVNGIKGAGDLTVSGKTLLDVVAGLSHSGSTTIDGGQISTPVLPTGPIFHRNGGLLYTAGLVTNVFSFDAGGLAIGAIGGDLTLQLGGGTGTVRASELQSVLTLNGPLATGQIDFLNPVDIDTELLTIKASQGGNACLAASGNYGSAYTLMAPLSGTGGLQVTGGSGGMVVLNHPSTYAGTTTIDGDGSGWATPYHGVTLYGREGRGLTAANLTLKNGGILATCGIFDRAIGTGDNQVQWPAAARGGFAAVGGDLAVRLNGNTNAITLGTTPAPGGLVLGSEFSTHTVDFQNALDTGGAVRNIAVAGFVETRISGDISGAGINIAPGSYGTLTLAGNNSFNTLQVGYPPYGVVLKCGSATAFGNASTLPANSGSVIFDLAGYSVAGNLTTINHSAPAGRGFIENSATDREAVWSGSATFHVFAATAFGGAGDIRMTGQIGSGNSCTLSKNGNGRLTLAGSSSYAANSGFAAGGGSLVLDFGADNTPKLPATGTGSLQLNSCAFRVLGNSDAATDMSVPALSIRTGQNSVTVVSGTNQNATLELGVCSRGTGGGAVDINLVNTESGTATVTTANTALHCNLLRDGANARSGYATFNGGRTWATGANGAITGLTTFDPIGTGNGNLDLAGDQTISTNSTINTLRFNGNVTTLTLGGAKLTLGAGGAIGGILMTPDASGPAMITNGQVTVGDNYEILVHQYNTNHELHIAALIPAGYNQALSKFGPGLLHLSNPANYFNGWVYIMGGTLRTDTINPAIGSGSSAIGRGYIGRHIALGGGARFLYTGADATSDRTFQLVGDGVIEAANSSGTLTLNGNLDIAGYPYNLTLQGSGSAVFGGRVRLADTGRAYGGWLGGTLIKDGTGSWTLRNADNRMQLLDIRAGTLNLGHPVNTLVDNAGIRIDGGATLGLSTNADKVGVVTLVNGAIAGGGTLQGYRYDVRNGTIDVSLAGPVSALTKTGDGTVTLTGANTYRGDTRVQAGTLVSANAVAGDVFVAADAILQATGEIGGNLTLDGALQVDAGSPGSLTVGGALILGGDCVVAGDGRGPYTIAAAAGRSGKFASVTPPFVATYTENSVTIAPPAGTILFAR